MTTWNASTGIDVDSLLQRGVELSKPTSTFDAIAFVVTAIAIISSFAWSYFVPKEGEIPIDFWYRVPQAQEGQSSARQKKAEARNIAIVFKEQNIDAVIFWGSQSGRAESLARRLAKSLQNRFGLRALAVDLDDYDHGYLPQLMQRNLCGFVLSTYGDGDPPDNTNGLWLALRQLQDSRATLENMRYIMFGLGNSNYRQYNRVADVVNSNLQKLGAQRYGEVGRGDDARGETERHFLLWRKAIEDELKEELNLCEKTHVYQPAFDVKEDPSIPSETLHLGEPAATHGRVLQGQMADSKGANAIPIASIRQLWESDDRLCLHVELDLGEQRLVKYKTGDHMAVWPSNPDHEVERMLSALGLLEKRQTPISINMRSDVGQVPVPSPTTIEALFRHYLEICGTLSLETVATLAEFAPTESARSRLHRITDDAEIFNKEVIEPHTTLADLLEIMGIDSSWNIPCSFFLEQLRPMQPRYYSISSSTMVHPRKASITAVVRKPLKLEHGDENSNAIAKGCYGLATSYLHALSRSLNAAVGNAPYPLSSLPTFSLDGPRGALSGSKIYGRVRQSAFKLPPKASTPIIMVGSGTGVAPFRAFMQERARQREIAHDVGKTLLFMGFRHPDVDFICESDWEQWREMMGADVFNFWAAFSRERPGKRVYVQDVLKQQAKEVMDVLENSFGSKFYICGSAQMARDVAAVLAEMRRASSGGTEEQALAWVKKLRQGGRLLEDVWG